MNDYAVRVELHMTVNMPEGVCPGDLVDPPTYLSLMTGD
jgi:hypothetical protein